MGTRRQAITRADGVTQHYRVGSDAEPAPRPPTTSDPADTATDAAVAHRTDVARAALFRDTVPAWAGEPLPLLAQHYTPDQVESVVLWLAQQSLPDLRQRQSIHREQIGMALRNRQPQHALSEQMRHDMTSDAISRQTFGTPQPGDHNRYGWQPKDVYDGLDDGTTLVLDEGHEYDTGDPYLRKVVGYNYAIGTWEAHIRSETKPSPTGILRSVLVKRLHPLHGFATREEAITAAVEWSPPQRDRDR